MKAVYLDPFSGISGNMFLGALLDAGFPFHVLEEELEKLNIGDYTLINEKVIKQGITARYFNVKLPEEHHDHDHHGHAHVHVHEHHHGHRNLHDIMEIIGSSALSKAVKEKAGKVFGAIAEAESKVHGKPVSEVHFHEVGAVDTIIDVVGTLLGLEYLGIERIYAGKITTGRGFVKCAHGLMPVPAPATAELLLGIPWQQGNIERELATPTGAALVRVLAEISEELPEGFTGGKIAYGAGTWDLEAANVLRMYIGEINETEGELIEAACNIDDMSGEIFAYAIEKLLREGALDAWAEPIMMKKGRPAYKLKFLAKKENLRSLLDVVFTETTTLGVRYNAVKRRMLERKFLDVKIPQGTVTVKYGILNGEVVNMAPEYESCRKAAAGGSIKDVYKAAILAAEEILHGQDS